MATADVKKLIQELIVPELKDLKSEVKTLHVEIQRLDEKIDSYRQESHTDLDALRSEMRSEFKRLDEKIDLSLQIRERLVALEAKMAAYERRN